MAIPYAARMLDPTAHGGSILKGFKRVLIGGKPAARVGDPHICPMVDGVKPHVGGAISQGSMTVRIGNARAARMGDLCGCNTVGISGMGVPPTVGPELPAPEAAPPPDTPDGAPGLHENEWEGAAVHEESADGAESLDILYARGERSGPGVSDGVIESMVNPFDILGTTKLELGLWRAKGKGETEDGTPADLEVNAVHVELEKDVLLGYDGDRVGLGAGAKIDADWVEGQYDTERREVPVVDGLLDYLGYSLEYETGGELGLGAGGGGGAHAFYDLEKEEFRLGGFLNVLFVEGRGSLVLRSNGGGIEGVGGAGLPNTIAQGCHNVLIGG